MREKIKLGDIIVFEGGDDWLSKIICLLTNSTVSHAAMIYSSNEIVEMEHQGIAVNHFMVSKGNKAHLLRLKNEPSMEPIMLAAKKYVEEGITYDFPALVLLAGLIIYKKVVPTPRFQKITDLILTGACLILDKFLNSLLQKGRPVKTMICSQLVYQIYLDCGKEYEIQIKDKLGDSGFVQNKDAVRLVELVKNQKSEAIYTASFERNKNDFIASIDEKLIIKELYFAMTEWEKIEEVTESIHIESTLQKTVLFIDLIEKILEIMQVRIPIPALFITPADLYEHTLNLRKVCDINLLKY